MLLPIGQSRCRMFACFSYPSDTPSILMQMPLFSVYWRFKVGLIPQNEGVRSLVMGVKMALFTPFKIDLNGFFVLAPAGVFPLACYSGCYWCLIACMVQLHVLALQVLAFANIAYKEKLSPCYPPTIPILPLLSVSVIARWLLYKSRLFSFFHGLFAIIWMYR